MFLILLRNIVLLCRSGIELMKDMKFFIKDNNVNNVHNVNIVNMDICKSFVKDKNELRQCKNKTKEEYCHKHKTESKRKYGRILSIIFSIRHKNKSKSKCSIS